MMSSVAEMISQKEIDVRLQNKKSLDFNCIGNLRISCASSKTSHADYQLFRSSVLFGNQTQRWPTK